MINSLKRSLTALGLFSILFVTLGCIPNIEAVDHRSAVFPATDPLTLYIDGNDMDVDIRTQAGIGEIQINATLRTMGTSREDAQNELKSINLEISQRGNQIRIVNRPRLQFYFGIHFGHHIEVEILMPPDADLDIRTDDGNVIVNGINGNQRISTDDGSIELFDVTGEFDLDSDDGSIYVRNATGSLHASTDDGDITYHGRLVGARHFVEADDGDVEFRIPADSALHIDVSLDDGHVHSTIPIQNEIDSDHHWSGTLNAPDSVLTIIVDDGSISIHELIQ